MQYKRGLTESKRAPALMHDSSSGVGVAMTAPHLPKDDANTGPLVSFGRSDIHG
jgi:hypothetical protein